MEIPEGYGQINWFWHVGSVDRTGQTTLGVILTDTPTQAELLAYHSARLNALMNLTSFNASIYKVTCQVGGGGPLVEASLDHHGSGAANMVPPGVCVLIKKHTAIGGRKNRGRMYWPGIPEAEVDDAGNIDPGVMEEWSLSADNLTGATGPIGGAVVLHTGPEVPSLITAVTVDTVVASQRRRQRR